MNIDHAGQVIRVELWDRARWRGVAYGRRPNSLPFLGLVFEDRDAATEILAGWRDLIGGEVDTEELIRIALVEGEVAGQGPGYTAHITPNTDLLLARARENNSPHENILSVTRLLRMGPSSHLQQFKESLPAFKRYLLVACALSATAQGFDVNPAVTIEKTRVEFRNIADVRPKNDIDSVVLARREGSTAHLN